MDTKKGNIIYSLFIFTVIPIFFTLLIIPLVSANNKNYSLDYNKVLKLNDYYIKVTDAAYLEDNETFAFLLSVIPENANIGAKGTHPKVTSIEVHYNKGKDEELAKKQEIKKLNDVSEIVFVQGVKDDIRYIELVISSSEPDYYDEDTVDEFGDPVKGKHHKGKEYRQRIIIDSKDIERMTSTEYSPEPKDIEKKEVSVTTTTNIGLDYYSTDYQPEDELLPVLTKTTTTSVSDENSSSPETENNSSSVAETETITVTTAPLSPDNNNNGGGGGNGGGNGGGGGNYYPEEDNNEPETTTTTTTTTSATTTTTTTTTRQTTTTTTKETTTTTTRPAVIHVNAISLDTGFEDNNVRLSIKAMHQVKAVVMPENATDRSVKWKSNREDIATVDENGVITAHSTGKAIITATTNDGGLSASCMVTVS